MNLSVGVIYRPVIILDVVKNLNCLWGNFVYERASVIGCENETNDWGKPIEGQSWGKEPGGDIASISAIENEARWKKWI